MNQRDEFSGRATRFLLFSFLALFTLAAWPGTYRAFAGEDALTLRVQDAIGAPGGRVAFVLRTYASRPIGQGQVCLVANPTGISNPAGVGALDSLENAVVLSNVGDVATEVTFDVNDDPQVVLLQFASPSASVNNSDGPLAALFFRLADNAVPGDTIELVLDVGNTVLYDEHGELIEIRPRMGELQVREPAAPHAVSMEAGEVRPGEDVTLSIQTLEPFPIAGGRIAVRYDAAIAVSRPSVRMDPRHGVAGFAADTSIPGLVIIDFESPGATLNSLPGDLIEFTFRTSDEVTDGTVVPILLDPALSFLTDAEGQLVPLTLENDELLFVGEAYKGGARHIETFAPPVDAWRLDVSQ